MRLTKEFSIRLVEFEASWQAISVQELWKPIEQGVIHFGYPKMHLVSNISESIRRMGSGDNFTTYSSEWLHISNVKEADRSTNKVNYILQMLKHNDRCTWLTIWRRHCHILPFKAGRILTLRKLSTLISATDKWRNTRWAHLLCFHHCQKEPCFRPVSQQVHNLRETHVRSVSRNIKLT